MATRTIPLNEYRREGYALYYKHTTPIGLLISATIAALLLTAGIALLLTVTAAVMALFGLTVEWSGFQHVWGSPFGAYDGKGILDFFALPFRIFSLLLPVDVFFSLLFCAAVIPERRAFTQKTEQERGRPAANIVVRNIPLIIFWGVLFVLTLFPMSPYFRETVPLMSIELPFSQTAPVLTVLVMLAFSFIAALVLQYMWNALLFSGLGIYHFFFVRGKNQVTKKMIVQRFSAAPDDELGF
jgi:hypothetical protein